MGRGESGLLICTVWRRMGSRSWLGTQKRCHNTNSSHQLYNISRVLSQGHGAFMSLLSWEGGEKQHFSAGRADRRVEKLLRFQACILGGKQHLRGLWANLCSSVFPSWSLQLPHGTVTPAKGPSSPNWVYIRGQTWSVYKPRDTPRPLSSLMCFAPHQNCHLVK